MSDVHAAIFIKRFPFRGLRIHIEQRCGFARVPRAHRGPLWGESRIRCSIAFPGRLGLSRERSCPHLPPTRTPRPHRWRPQASPWPSPRPGPAACLPMLSQDKAVGRIEKRRNIAAGTNPLAPRREFSFEHSVSRFADIFVGSVARDPQPRPDASLRTFECLATNLADPSRQ